MTPRSRRPPAVAFPRPSLRGNDGSLEEFLLPSRKDVRSLRGRNDGGATNPTLHAGRMAMLYVMLLSWKPGLGRDQMDKALPVAVPEGRESPRGVLARGVLPRGPFGIPGLRLRAHLRDLAHLGRRLRHYGRPGDHPGRRPQDGSRDLAAATNVTGRARPLSGKTRPGRPEGGPGPSASGATRQRPTHGPGEGRRSWPPARPRARGRSRRGRVARRGASPASRAQLPAASRVSGPAPGVDRSPS